MSQRATSLAAAIALLIATLATTALAADSPGKGKRNVLFIAVDDLNNDIGCYGNPEVKTPNIDRLAAHGVRFDRAYCQYPLCNPSRTSFLSGRRPDTTKVTGNGTPPRQSLGDVVMLPEFFRKEGYFTARVGKIAHDSFADAVTWDVSESSALRREGAAKAAAKTARKALAKKAAAQGTALKIQWLATDNADKDERDGATARRIVELIEEHKDGPFFIAAGFHKPHLPFVAPRAYFAMYPPDRIKLPDGPADDRKDIPEVALTRTKGDDEMTDAEKRQAIAAYRACTTFTDAQVGLLLDAMDRLKLWDDTVVLFLGDHGFHLGEHGGLWRKMTVFEEAARVPLIVAAPGKKAGVASSRLVELVDIYPTLTSLCGLSAPEGMEGISFAPLLDDPDRPWKLAAFTQVARGRGIMGRSIRTDRFRYTEWGDPKTAELYDHTVDEHEYTNLARDPKYAEFIPELSRRLHDGWRAALPAR